VTVPVGCRGAAYQRTPLWQLVLLASQTPNPEHRPPWGVVFDTSRRKAFTAFGIEGIMATRQHGQIVETPTEARQGERGPSVLALLAISTGLAVLILGLVWFVFFRT
jgi:hypothetical protein